MSMPEFLHTDSLLNSSMLLCVDSSVDLHISVVLIVLPMVDVVDSLVLEGSAWSVVVGIVVSHVNSIIMNVFQNKLQYVNTVIIRILFI